MSIPYKIEPWAHQRAVLKHLEGVKCFALFWEMGTGKTLVAINFLRLKFYRRGEIFHTLIIVPAVMLPTWEREIAKHASSAVAENTIVITSRNKHKFEQYLTTHKIFIMSFGSIPPKRERGGKKKSKSTVAFFKAIKAAPWKGLIIDESHYIKNPKAEIAKAILKFSDPIDYKLILTGTPLLKDVIDLHPQISVLSKNIFPQPWYVARDHWFKDKLAKANIPDHKRFPIWEIRPGAEQRIKSQIEPISSVMKKEQCLDLPPLLVEDLELELEEHQARLYEDLRRDAVAYLDESGEGEAVVSELTITQIMRLRQICSGLAVTEEGTHKPLDTHKPALLKHVLESINKAGFIVWSSFPFTYEAIRIVISKAGLSFGEITRDKTPAERQQAIDDFQAGKVHGILASPAVGGVGIGLQRASYMVYYAFDFNLAHWQQSAARAHRGGNTNTKITQFNFVCKNTIEVKILESLKEKKNLQERILTRSKARALLTA